MSKLGGGPEFDLIRSFLADAPPLHSSVRVGPGDDCTIIGNLAISTDASVEGVHFRRDWLDAFAIGWRASAAALSDLAAVAAEPIGVMVSLALPEPDRADFARNVMRGVAECVKSFGGSLLGGDTTSAPVLVIDVAVVGRVVDPVLRNGARAGDEIWVTGRLGGAAAAISCLQNNDSPNAAALERYATPRPRTREALWLKARVEVHAMIDLSDGLFGDVSHIAAASGCAIEIDSELLPVDRQSGATYEHAVAGGDDYELCFAAAPGAIEALREEFERSFGIEVTRIGAVRGGEGVHERRADGSVAPVTLRGYQHFRD
jgi:thiamine-monophosphate kinase